MGLLQVEIGDALLLPVLLLQHALGLPCRLDRHWLHRLQHLGRDNIIYASAAQTEAAAMSGLQVRQVAPIDRTRDTPGTTAATDIGGLEVATAAATTDEAG